MSFTKYIPGLAAGLTIGIVLAAFLLLSNGDGADMFVNKKTRIQEKVSTQPPDGVPPALSLSPNGAGWTETGGNAHNDTKNIGGDSVSTKFNNRIKMTFGNEEVIVTMYDNPTTRDFLTRLPLTLTLKDYAGTEKISYLPKKLSIKDAPAGSDPAPGDFTYYSPWGNIAIFYQDFGYADGLIILGSMEPGGAEKLARMSGDFTVTVVKAD